MNKYWWGLVLELVSEEEKNLERKNQMGEEYIPLKNSSFLKSTDLLSSFVVILLLLTI